MVCVGEVSAGVGCVGAVLTSATPLRAADVRGYCLQAQHLPKMDLFGSVDPYCVLSLGNQERKSRIIKKIYNPEWKEDPVRRCKRPLRPGVLQGLRRDWVFIKRVCERECVYLLPGARGINLVTVLVSPPVKTRQLRVP